MQVRTGLRSAPRDRQAPPQAMLRYNYASGFLVLRYAPRDCSAPGQPARTDHQRELHEPHWSSTERGAVHRVPGSLVWSAERCSCS